jgi:chemotaxis signal transduction protein
MVTRATDDLNLVRCTAAGTVLGADVSRVVSVERGEALARRPSASAPGLLRTANGECRVYALARDSRASGQVLVFAARGGRVGLLVDRVAPVERVPRANVRPVPPGALAGAEHALAAVALTANGPVGVLDADALGTAVRARSSARVELSEGHFGPKDRLLTFARADLPTGRAAALAVPVGAVAEVFDAPSGAPVPGGTSELVLWRENPITVRDAAAWVGLPPAAGRNRRAVVVKLGAHAVGLWAGDAVAVLPGGAPCAVARRAPVLVRDRVQSVLDTDALCVVLPKWELLLGE